MSSNARETALLLEVLSRFRLAIDTGASDDEVGDIVEGALERWIFSWEYVGVGLVLARTFLEKRPVSKKARQLLANYLVELRRKDEYEALLATGLVQSFDPMSEENRAFARDRFLREFDWAK